MRRFLLLLMALLLAGCGKHPETAEPVETTAAATEETLGTLPAAEYATAEADGVPVVLAVLSRGDAVDVAGSFDEKHYIVKLETGYGLVEKNLLRLEGETPFAEWTGYAYQNAGIYASYRLTGGPVQTLKADTQVKVLEDLGWCYLVEYDGTAGYMKQETVAKNPVTSRKKQAPASGNAGGTQGEDGGEISLGISGGIVRLSTLAPQEGAVSRRATVLAEETLAVLGYFDRGDKIPILGRNEKEGYLTVYLDGLTACVADSYVQTEAEQAYEAWDGRTDGIVSLYEDFWMLGSPSGRLNGNVAVRVLFELEDCYLVEAEGMTGYMTKTDVVQAPEETVPEAASPTEPIVKPTKPAKPAEPAEATTPAETPDDAGNAGGEATAPAQPEWTPPVL